MTNIRNALMQAAGSASGDPVYVEDVFSTHLFTGTQSTLAINNGIDLDDKGGLVWFKARNNARNHALFDTERGNNLLYSSTNAAQSATTTAVTATNSNGFTVGSDTQVNKSGETIVAWTFAKQEGFFDVVTYTGDGTSARTVSHNLGCKPGMIIVKRTDSSADWQVWHRYTNLTYSVAHLNTTAAWTNTGGDNAAFADAYGNATNFTLGAGSRLNDTNENSATYVAYLFAGQGDADSQIFGDDGDEAIIKCGSYTGTGNTSLSVNLGFEPQWLLIKASSGGNAASQYWAIYDVMRGWTNVTGSTKYLAPNLSSAEATWWDLQPTSTGFASTADSGTRANESGTTYIYMAIRRGPMKEPSAGTDVLGMNGSPGSSDYAQLTTGNLVDVGWQYLNGDGAKFFTRLLGKGYLNPTSNAAANTSAATEFDYMNGFAPYYANNIASYTPRQVYGFRRYPKVFDVSVVNSTTSSAANYSHNLGVAPEFFISKRIDGAGGWVLDQVDYYLLSSNGADLGSQYIVFENLTATTYGAKSGTFSSGESHLVFMFASLDGISKVGTYTGTGNDVNVTGLNAAARFVMIKRTDNTGDWYVFDTTQGIVSGNDPYFFINSTAVSVTNTDYIDPHSSGFTITSSAPDALNASGGTYRYLAFS